MVFACTGLLLLSGQGCPLGGLSTNDVEKPVYNNTTDPGNGRAIYLGSAACRACHPNIDALQFLHGHAHMLNRIQGDPPTYPSVATRADVPQPPVGHSWSDLSYVIGGYLHKAHFVDQDGYLLTTGREGAGTQWNLLWGPNDTPPGFVAYEPAQTSRKPYAYSCFVCHATGPRPQNPADPLFQENRPGMAGTWAEAGVQCEACHGPGSRHVPNPSSRDQYVDTTARFCGRCHSRSVGADANIIQASDGFIDGHERYSELRASGGHADFDCIACHDPHTSVTYDRTRALHRQCSDCHKDKNMGYHEGRTYVRGDYVEPITCESCHMPFASRTGSSAVVGESGGRIGDTRTHVFRINTEPVGYTAMYSADLNRVQKDAQGRAAVTVDYVCLRCHHTGNGYPFKLTVQSASEIALGIHGFRE